MVMTITAAMMTMVISIIKVYNKHEGEQDDDDAEGDDDDGNNHQ